MSELAITFVSKYDIGIPMGICFTRTVHSFLEYFSELNNANFFFSKCFTINYWVFTF